VKQDVHCARASINGTARGESNHHRMFAQQSLGHQFQLGHSPGTQTLAVNHAHASVPPPYCFIEELQQNFTSHGHGHMMEINGVGHAEPTTAKSP
jgi:hypothetical protein